MSTGAALTVMTRNLYVGSEFAPVMEARSLQEVLEAVPAVHREIVDSNFPERAESLADEIADAAPDLIGLQEAVLVRSGPADDDEPTEDELDYLQLLLDALGRRGTRYEAVEEVWNIDASMPSGFPPTRKLRLTDRGALLARTGIELSTTQTGSFRAKAIVDVGGSAIPFTRGWVAAELRLEGRPVRLVTTHLETSRFPEAQLAQAEELLAGPVRTELPTILIGDLNTRAPESPAYRRMLEEGFVDAWTTAFPGDPGLTCCQDPQLTNERSKLYERIDFVLLRGPFVVLDVRRTGATPDTRTPSGLWPSDHAGLVATLALS